MTSQNDSLFSKETKAAIQNFQISDKKFHKIFLKSLIEIKRAAATTNSDLKTIDASICKNIIKSCDQLLRSFNKKLFPLDIFQTGSGTSVNMNVNEVIANLSSTPSIKVHPNDHVNWGQSSNCVIPSAINIANRILIDPLLEELKKLKTSFDKLAIKYQATIKIGRTHLQDAVPMSFGQELSAYSQIMVQNIKRISALKAELSFLPIGGTAIGTGIASHQSFSQKIVSEISKRSKISFKVSINKFASISTREEQVALMASLSTLASSMIKIANDLRLLASGPNTGFGEITFAKLQAGSSVMPGKVNPVIMEAMIQVAAYVIGNATTINIANQNGPLQLNIMLPLIAYVTIDSIEIMTKSLIAFNKLGITKMIVNDKQMQSYVRKSTAIITILKNHPKFGYDLTNTIVAKAIKNKQSIYEVIKAEKIISDRELDKIFNFKKMI